MMVLYYNKVRLFRKPWRGLSGQKITGGRFSLSPLFAKKSFEEGDLKPGFKGQVTVRGARVDSRKHAGWEGPGESV